MKTATLPKTGLLRTSPDYQNVYRHGRRLHGLQFSIISIPNGREESRVGISVHGVRKAFRRNRIKRLFREFFRLNRAVFWPTVDVVFAVRAGFPLNSLRAVEEAALALIRSK